MLHAVAYSTTSAVGLPPIIADIPFAPGDIVVYLLVGASVFMVLHFGLKKPKGPSDTSKT